MTQDERWIANWKAVMDFMKANKRRPSKYDDTERGLYYNWLRHNMKLYNSGGMKTERVEKFNLLLELTERYRKKNQWE